MRENRKNITVKKILFLSLVSCFALISLFPAQAAAQETEICTDTAWQGNASIFADMIVWCDTRNGNNDIFLYNTTTKTETTICAQAANQNLPKIYADKIVWEDERNGNADIFMYNLSTGMETTICALASGQYSPSIFDNKIVWSDSRNGNRDIFMYDIITGDETTICAQAADQYQPVIFNNIIVWSDTRNGLGNADIFMYDLATQTETTVCAATGNQVFTSIFNNRIVWADSRAGNADIYMYNILTGDETPVCTDTAAQSYPFIFGEKITWSDNRSGNYDIYLYDILLRVETPVCTQTSTQYNPVIYGEKLVWDDFRTGNWDIYMYDFTYLYPKVENPICTDSKDQFYPAIFGDKIVWDDLRNGNWDIYMYDMLTKTESPICTNTAYQRLPSIFGNKIVWEDERNVLDYDIYMYDLETRIETPICTQTGDQRFPKIHGNRIVWEDNRNGNNDIYMFDLATNTETPICTHPYPQENPTIFGDKIVWYDARNRDAGDPFDIYMIDLLTMTQAPLCTRNGAQTSPIIYGNKVSWVDGRDLNLEIYLYDLVTEIETKITSGTALQQSSSLFADKISYYDMRNGNQNDDIFMYDLYRQVETTICAELGNQWQNHIYNDKIAWSDARDYGNTKWDIWMLGPDVTAPKTTLSTEPPNADGENGWFVTVPTITLTRNEPGTTYYQWNSTTGSWTAYSGAFKASNGEHTLYYYSVDTLNIKEDTKSAALKIDTVRPDDPSSLSSTSHTVDVWSNDNTVDMRWSGATDTISGVDGYSISWTKNTIGQPDMTKDKEEFDETHTSPPLSNGSWYFNLRTKDNAGNWTATIHDGPFKIDAEKPSKPYNLSWNNVTTSSVSLSWSACYDNVGVTAYVLYDDEDDSTVTSTADTTCYVSNLAPITAYHYYLKAFDAAGNVSLKGNVLEVITARETSAGFIAPGSEISTEVAVTLPNGNNASVGVFFDQVNNGGVLNISATDGQPAGPPSGFRVGDDAYYSISFSGVFSGYLYLTLPFDPALSNEAALQLKIHHFKDGEWIDCTYSHDLVNHTVTGRVTSLSPFGMFVPAPATGMNVYALLLLGLAMTGIGAFLLRKPSTVNS